MKWFALLLCAPALGARSPTTASSTPPASPATGSPIPATTRATASRPLSQITPANVGGLRVKWAYQMESRAEVSPIVVDGVMYVTGPNTAAALDLRTGRELVDLEAAHSEGLSEHRIRPREPRARHSR